MYGYSFISAMPVESSGVNLARTAINNRWNKKPCMAMASDAGVVQGMSGGAVYNADQTISGVIVGYSHEIANVRSKKVILKDVSLYIPYGDFKRWLEANIGQTPQTAPGPAYLQERAGIACPFTHDDGRIAGEIDHGGWLLAQRAAIDN